MPKYTYMTPTIPSRTRRGNQVHLCLGDASMTLCGQLAVGNWQETGGDDTGTEATCQLCLQAR